MPLNVKDGVRLSLQAPLAPSSGALRVSLRDAQKLNYMNPGDWAYLTLQWNDAIEIVKYTHGSDFVAGAAIVDVPVERAVNGTSATSFPTGVCANMDWSTIQLCEFVQQCIGSTP